MEVLDSIKQVLRTQEMEVAESTNPQDGMEVLHTVEMDLTDANDVADGKVMKEKVTFLEMKTFKRNVRSLEGLEESTELDPLKIICVGEFTGGVRAKGVFIKDYLGIKPTARIHPFNSIDFYLKRVNWLRRGDHRSHFSIVLQLCEISDMERFSAMTKVFFQHSQGALVFWGPRDPSSLARAVQWKAKIAQEVHSPIPCVLVTENIKDSQLKSMEWIGPGKIFENELALDKFCRRHGFVDHFEIKCRDWLSGEESVFGQAVTCALDEILQNEHKQDKTWI